jgi:predicted LPLAT superfamily acyltransferase
MTSTPRSRDEATRAALRQTRIVANRVTFNSGTRREVNRALDALEAQLGRNQVNATETARALELLNRAHSSLLFSLLRDRAVAERYAAALRELGLRGVSQRLDEVPHSVMAEPIPGPTAGRRHRDELSAEDRTDAVGNPLPPPRAP